MGTWDELGDFDDEGEATAILNAADLRRAMPRRSQTHHLLVHAQGTELGRVRVLDGPELTVGRSTDADIWINDDGVSRRHARLLLRGESYVLEDLRSANGTFVQGERISERALQSGDQVQLGPTALFRYSVTDDDQKALLEQLYSTSVTDALTGARNREYLDSLLVSELSYARRHEQPVSFVLFDLDHFKRVNDRYGHPAGDSVLIAVANAVRGELRAEDVLCRYGGEEFGVVLRGVGLQGAASMGERIRGLISALTIRHEQLSLSVTASVGCAASIELPEATPSELIATADRRLYAAKESGRNRVVASG